MGFGGGSGGSSNLGGASDVALNSVANSQPLQYNSTLSKWQNGAVASRLVESINTVASAGSTETIPDVTTATVHLITLSTNCTFTFPTPTAGKSFTIRLTQGSNYTVTWPATVRWAGGIAPTLTTTSGRHDVFSFVCFVDGTWFGFVAGQNFS